MNGATYHYVVSAQNSGGPSADSNEASATPTAPPVSPWTGEDVGAVEQAGLVERGGPGEELGVPGDVVPGRADRHEVGRRPVHGRVVPPGPGELDAALAQDRVELGGAGLAPGQVAAGGEQHRHESGSSEEP